MKKITSLRNLVIVMDSGVDLEVIGKGLMARIDLWISRKEVKIINGKLYRAY